MAIAYEVTVTVRTRDPESFFEWLEAAEAVGSCGDLSMIDYDMQPVEFETKDLED